jgi:hypothetical protein
MSKIVNFLSSLCGNNKHEHAESPEVTEITRDNSSYVYNVYFNDDEPIKKNITLSELNDIVKKYPLHVTKIGKIKTSGYAESGSDIKEKYIIRYLHAKKAYIRHNTQKRAYIYYPYYFY